MTVKTPAVNQSLTDFLLSLITEEKISTHTATRMPAKAWRTISSVAKFERKAARMTCMKRRHMDIPPTVVISTDYTCIPFFEETECDYYIIPHEDLLEEDIEKGLPAEKLYPFGIPVSPSFQKKTDKEKAKVKLHLQPINLIVLEGSYQLTLWDILSWRGLHA